MKKFIAAIIAVIMVLSLAACGGPKAPTIELESNTGYDYMEIYISPTSEDTWGQDLLNGQTITRGQSVQLQLAASENNSYDMKIVDEDGDWWVFENFQVADGARVIVSGSSMEVIANNRSTTFSGDLQMQGGSTSAPATMRINLANQTGDDFTYCYMSPSTSSDWGSDLFTGSTSDIVIFDDQESGYIDVTGDAGSYDLKLADGQSDFVAWGGLDVHDGSTIVVTVVDGQWAAIVDGTAYAASNAQGSFNTVPTPVVSDEVRINMINNSEEDFFSFKCSHSSDSEWGSDLFLSSTSDISIFNTEETGYVIIPAEDGDTYDLQLKISGTDIFAEWGGIELHNGSTVVITGDQSQIYAQVDGETYAAHMTTH